MNLCTTFSTIADSYIFISIHKLQNLFNQSYGVHITPHHATGWGTHTHTYTHLDLDLDWRPPSHGDVFLQSSRRNQWLLEQPALPKWPLLIDFVPRTKLENTLGACKTALVQERRIFEWVLTSQNGTLTQKTLRTSYISRQAVARPAPQGGITWILPAHTHTHTHTNTHTQTHTHTLTKHFQDTRHVLAYVPWLIDKV